MAKITITLYVDPPDTAAKFIEYFQRKLTEIPEAERATAKIWVDQGYDQWGHLEMAYEHEETAEELAAQERDRQQVKTAAEEREKKEFLRLAEKFGYDAGGK